MQQTLHEFFVILIEEAFAQAGTSLIVLDLELLKLAFALKSDRFLSLEQCVVSRNGTSPVQLESRLLCFFVVTLEVDEGTW